ncbi:hypothetical protein AMATHDRAFT_143632 [Amanita thiersii Skay4041]|uniref:Core Histone H2A/H2B/H3 domain-containing protein n=1 Tax=Amanita thiersii Skay4041 TaxID=703135 RepID=A0A2A9NJ57_9AGAR|nr:hypothetical protein AMATHDRAFT_143632 [Amanita thiersii Skay4041]
MHLLSFNTPHALLVRRYYTRHKRTLRPSTISRSTRSKASIKPKHIRQASTSASRSIPITAPRFIVPSHTLPQIHRFGRSTALLLRRDPFQQLVRTIAKRELKTTMHIQAAAISTLHNAAETYLLVILQHAVLAALHARRSTLYPSDVALAFQTVKSERERFRDITQKGDLGM